jgi:cysteine desulfurase
LRRLSRSCQLDDDVRAGVLTILLSLIRIFRGLLISRYSQRDHARVQELSNRLIQGINAQVEHVVRNGDVNGYAGCVNLSFAYVEGESLLMALKV